MSERGNALNAKSHSPFRQLRASSSKGKKKISVKKIE